MFTLIIDIIPRAFEQALRAATVIGACIFTHEFGHYLACRAIGVTPSLFVCGMGPTLLRLKDRRGTEWHLCLLPIGGFVEITFSGLKRTAQIFIALAGPLTNFFTSFLLLIYLSHCDLLGPHYANQTPAAILFKKLSMQFHGIFCLLKDLFRGNLSTIQQNIAGPLQILNHARQSQNLLQSVCNLGIALGAFNLLPILPLDGGRIICALLGIDLEKDSTLTKLLYVLCMSLFATLIFLALSSDLFSLVAYSTLIIKTT